ncbi:SpoVG family protein [bacterium]|nr:SpoVG family protein [bacterium]
MKITEVSIKLANEEKLKGFANITFDDVFVVRGIKIINGSEGLFISMPSRKLNNGEYRDIVHPIQNDFRIELEKAILDEYEKSLSQVEQ